MEIEKIRIVLMSVLLAANFLLADEPKGNRETAEAWRILEGIRSGSAWGMPEMHRYLPRLWKLKDPEVARVLIDTLEMSPLLQHYVLLKLGEIKSTHALPKIISIARRGVPWWVQSTAIAVLGEIKHPASITTLLDILESKEKEDDVKNRIIRIRCSISLHQITGEGEQLSLEISPQKANEIFSFWKRWGKENRAKYEAIEIPIDNLPYADPVSGFLILKPSSEWKMETYVYRDGSLCFYCYPRQGKKETSIAVWAEKTTDDCLSIEAGLPEIERKRIQSIENYEKIAWKKFDFKGMTGYRLLYRGEKEGKKYYFVSNVLFFSGNFYHLLLQVPLEKRNDGIAHLKELFNYFDLSRK